MSVTKNWQIICDDCGHFAKYEETGMREVASAHWECYEPVEEHYHLKGFGCKAGVEDLERRKDQ